MKRWILTTRKPDSNRRVLIYVPDRYPKISVGYWDGTMWLDETECRETPTPAQVTRWMSLPLGPGE